MTSKMNQYVLCVLAEKYQTHTHLKLHPPVTRTQRRVIANIAWYLNIVHVIFHDGLKMPTIRATITWQVIIHHMIANHLNRSPEPLKPCWWFPNHSWGKLFAEDFRLDSITLYLFIGPLQWSKVSVRLTLFRGVLFCSLVARKKLRMQNNGFYCYAPLFGQANLTVWTPWGLPIWGHLTHFYE